MKRSWLLILLAGLIAAPSHSQEAVSSDAIGIYDPSERPLLAPAFTNAVNSWLRRYEPRLIERKPDHVRMQVDYDFIYDVELLVQAEEFVIRVTLAEKTTRTSKARKQSAALSAGVLRSMENTLMRGSRVRERTRPAQPQEPPR